MNAGSIIKVAFVQSDMKIKFRPAVVLKRFKPYNDFLVCGISKSIGIEVKGFDIVINQNHIDFKKWGLNYPGVIRLGFLQTIPENIIEGELGNICSDTHKQLIRNLIQFLEK